jgi:hypothetical protein
MCYACIHLGSRRAHLILIKLDSSFELDDEVIARPMNMAISPKSRGRPGSAESFTDLESGRVLSIGSCSRTSDPSCPNL